MKAVKEISGGRLVDALVNEGTDFVFDFPGNGKPLQGLKNKGYLIRFFFLLKTDQRHSFVCVEGYGLKISGNQRGLHCNLQ